MNEPAQEGAGAVPATPFYSTHVDYSSLVAGAHRRRVTPIGAPALTRHLVFWNPIDRPEPNVSGGSTDWTRLEEVRILTRKVQADRLVGAIYGNLVDRKREGKISRLRMVQSAREAGEEPVPLFRVWMSEIDGSFRQKPPHAPASDSYRAIKIYFDWQGLPTVLSMELHAEFLTLTTIIDLSQPEQAVWHPSTVADPCFSDLTRHLNEVGRLYSAGATDPDDWCEAHKFIYYDVWDRFEEILFAAPGIDSLKKTRGVAHPTRFIDFRGLLLAVDPTATPDAEEADWIGSARLRAPFSRRSQPGTGNERKACCTTADFDRIWPFLKSGFDDKITEFTLSRYLGRRAFFATALAEQPDMVGKPGTGPLCYLVLEDTLNAWQLGRLVYRIHRGGTARVAAMMHFKDIQNADGILARVEHKLQESLRNATPLREQDEDKEHNARESLREDNDTVEAMLAGISDTLELDGSLDFRIERSRYYVSQFERITRSLRITRVQGFQTYVEFVGQRLGPVFDYIDRVGHRYARVQSDRGLLLRRLLTLEALYEERFISRAQRVADGALYGILGPYYLISIIEHSEWLNSEYLWRTGLAYSGFYLIFLALKPKRPVGSPRGWLARVRANSPAQVWVRLLVSLGLAVAGVTLWYSAQADGWRSILRVEDSDAHAKPDGGSGEKSKESTTQAGTARQ